jgi:hypothetical protein
LVDHFEQNYGRIAVQGMLLDDPVRRAALDEQGEPLELQAGEVVLLSP